jgi:hypothetical protein
MIIILRLTCDGDVSIGLSLFDDLEDLIGRSHEPLGDAFHVRYSILVLVNRQVVLGHYNKTIWLYP